MTIIKAVAVAALFAATSSAVFAQEGDAAKRQEIVGAISQHPELRVDPIRIQVIDQVIYVSGQVDDQAELDTLDSLIAVEKKTNQVNFDVEVETTP